MGGYDGTLKFDTKIDTQGFNKGTKDVTKQMGTLVKSIKAVGVAIATSFVVKAIKSTIDAAEELENAMTGLKSVMEGQGKSFNKAQKFINQYTEDGLIPASNAITAYKNLALRGYSTEQIEKVMIALKDSATYGRQSAYTLGQAVQSASEGLKNENSILVDNAGVTKNVAKMWQDYAKSIGKTTNNLTQQEKIEAEVNGILEETKFQTGDAARYMNSYSGLIARLSQQWLTFKQTIGSAFMTLAQAVLPIINAIMAALIKLANVFKLVITTLFGRLIKTNNNVSKSAIKAGNAIADMGDAAEGAGKQAQDALAPFDKLNVLQQDTGSGSSSGSSGGGVDLGDIGEIEVDTDEVEAIPQILQNVLDKIQETIARMKDAFRPTIVAWTNSFKDLWTGVQPILQQFGVNFKALFTDVLEPLADTFIFEFLAPVINAFSERFAPMFTGYILQRMQLFADTFGNFVDAGSGLVENVFSPALIQLRDTLLEVMPSIMDSLQTFFDLSLEVGDYILNDFLLPVGVAIVETVAPAFTDVLSFAIQEFAKNFELAMKTIKSIWEEIFKPTFDLIKKVVIDTLDVIKELWEQYGPMILESVGEFFDNLRTHWEKLYNQILIPIVKPFLEELKQLWDEYGKDIVRILGFLIISFVEGALEIYNKFVAPLINFLIDILAPTISSFVQKVNGTIENFKSYFVGLYNSIVTIMTGIYEFLAGVFTNNWRRAWEGWDTIATGIFEGMWNKIKLIINSVIEGINFMIRALNGIAFDIPDWVPEIGGNHFGFNIREIPKLATGAVIPPNAEFMAVLGDQKNGRNLEAPEDLIRQIVREETEAIARRPIYVKAEVSGKTLMDIVAEQDEERNRAYGYDTGGGSFAY